jgi:hypothetical protein
MVESRIIKLKIIPKQKKYEQKFLNAWLGVVASWLLRRQLCIVLCTVTGFHMRCG